MAKTVQDDGKVKVDLDTGKISLAGVKIEDDCPTCKKVWDFDGDSDAAKGLTYPIVGDRVTLWATCSTCGEGWNVEVSVGIKISL